MPELPEVETIRRQLAPLVVGRRITSAEILDPRWCVPQSVEEVEAALQATGLFADVAVVGVPDPEWGEAVVACHPGGMAIDPAAVAGRIAGLAGFKRPKRYVLVGSLPKNNYGKVLKTELRARLA